MPVLALLLFRPLPLGDGNAGPSDSLVLADRFQIYYFSREKNLRTKLWPWTEQMSLFQQGEWGVLLQKLQE